MTNKRDMHECVFTSDKFRDYNRFNDSYIQSKDQHDLKKYCFGILGSLTFDYTCFGSNTVLT